VSEKKARKHAAAAAAAAIAANEDMQRLLNMGIITSMHHHPLATLPPQLTSPNGTPLSMSGQQSYKERKDGKYNNNNNSNIGVGVANMPHYQLPPGHQIMMGPHGAVIVAPGPPQMRHPGSSGDDGSPSTPPGGSPNGSNSNGGLSMGGMGAPSIGIANDAKADFKCPQCTRRFTHRGNLNRHVRTHTGEKPYTCPHCGKRFTMSSNMKIHIRTHTRERPFICAIPGCQRSFTTSSDKKKHGIPL
jgi:predicted RNA-binding Zn-ribbon protein involved in translation (DUF1610 family)